MRFEPIYKAQCEGCERKLNHYQKVCYKCGTYNEVDWIITFKFYGAIFAFVLLIAIVMKIMS